MTVTPCALAAYEPISALVLAGPPYNLNVDAISLVIPSSNIGMFMAAPLVNSYKYIGVTGQQVNVILLTPDTLHPTPYTLHPTPYILHLSSCNLTYDVLQALFAAQSRH